jgi:hypothetical protein
MTYSLPGCDDRADQPTVAPTEAATAVLGQLTTATGTWFEVDLSGVRLEAADTDWNW